MTITRRSTLQLTGAIGSLLLLWLAWRCLDSLVWVADFSTQPPAQVFQEAMGKPLPKGVSNIRVAGRHYFIKRWAWMRLQANGQAIKSIIALSQDTESLSGLDARRKTQSTQEVGNNRWNKYDDMDRKLVGWDEVAQISHPEVYELWADRGWLWSGIMIVDRQKGLVYIYSLSD